MMAAAAVLGAMALAAPAHADNARGYDHSGYNSGYGHGYGLGHARGAFSREALWQIEQRIDRGFQSGRLNRWEARRLYASLADLRQRARHYARDGLSRWERQDLDNRTIALRNALRLQLRDDDYRDPYRR
jgi:hypothetical protein